MANVVTQWILELKDNVSGAINRIQQTSERAAVSVGNVGKNAGGLAGVFKCMSAIDFAASAYSVQQLTDAVQEAVQPGVEFDSQLKNIQSVTGVSGQALDDLGEKARDAAKAFGIDASSQLEAYQGVIARFGPAIASNGEALSAIGNDVATLSKLMGDDATGAMDALTTAMLQFGVDVNNPAVAAREASRMMNVMAAAGNEGASEVADTAAALKQAGVAAFNANVSFEETNSALQALAQGGMTGSEAGVGLRNVLTKMSSVDIVPRTAREKLKELGINFGIVSDKSLPLTTRLRELSKAQKDSALVAQIFGVENMNAANLLLRSIPAQEEMTKKITGTNAATESAGVVMGSFQERVNRTMATIKDWGISAFNATKDFLPFITMLSSGIVIFANFMGAIQGFRAFIGVIKALSVATRLQAAAQWLLNIAMNANPIGVVLLLTGALVTAFSIAFVKCKGFHSAIMGLWGVMKNFGTILKNFVIDRIHGLLNGIGALGQALQKLFSGDFSGAWDTAVKGFKDITGVNARKNAADAIAKSYANARDASDREWDRTHKGRKGTASPLQQLQADMTAPAMAAGSGSGSPGGGHSGKGGFATSGGSGGLSASGGTGGGSHVTMNVRMYNNFYGGEDSARKVVQQIADRLNDEMAVVS